MVRSGLIGAVASEFYFRRSAMREGEEQDQRGGKHDREDLDDRRSFS